jgi:effector-binding domain-containing protein
MLTNPTIVERSATSYAAVAREVRIPFGEAIGPAMGEVVAYLDGAKVGGFGPAVFRYDVIDMPRLEMQFGFVTSGMVAGNDSVRPGVLPAGRYVTATYTGHYDNVETATGEVIDWARRNNVEWDSTPGRTGERFASRFEIYPNGPDDEPDPNKWVTEIWIKVKG